MTVDSAMVAAPVDPVPLVPDVVEPELPLAPSSAAAPGLPLAVVVDVDGLLAVSVGMPLVALDAAAVVGRLSPVGNTLLARGV